jgi:hypothetical protein
MKTIVFGNCATVTYGETIKEIFPDWEIRRVDLGEGLRWLADGSKPEFTQYLRTCDLYVGHPMGEWPSIAAAVNPAADRVLIPSLIFRGLHPDIAIVPGFDSPVGNAQTSLIAVAARALDLGVAETVKLYQYVGGNPLSGIDPQGFDESPAGGGTPGDPKQTPPA